MAEKNSDTDCRRDIPDQCNLFSTPPGNEAATSTKVAEDGHIVLAPRPSSDPRDPLNWSYRKKHTILFIVALSAFIGDFGAIGIPCVGLQGLEWNMSPNKVNYATNLNVLMVGIGGVIWIPPVSFWGRAPVLFWTTLIGTIFTLLCAVAPDFDTFYAARAIAGLTLTAGQTIGLAFIKDMFFFHEHARKIGLWVCFFFTSVYFGPLFGSFMVDSLGKWRPCFWLVFALCCLDLVLIVAFVDETWYIRGKPLAQQPHRGLKVWRVLGVWQIQHHNYFLTIPDALVRLLEVPLKPIIVPVLLYYAATFMWAVGINVTSSILFATPAEAGGYGYSARQVGILYFNPIVALVPGECFGHFFNDWLANRYIRKHKGIFKPEARLRANYFAVPFMIVGLVLVGQGLEKRLSIGAVVMGWGMYVFGLMIASVGITAYALGCYPAGSGEVSSLLNFARTVGGFTVGYFQQPWGRMSGYGTLFGIQAGIVAAAVVILACVHVFGGWMRANSGPLRY